ncbi:MAG: 4Fe-4S binding protein [Deltaproteobacteria bacterium]|nr:4Fe-4S binding protein [Deltaproteobacteria bacterium]
MNADGTGRGSTGALVAAFFLTSLLLVPVHLMVRPPMLLAERFVKGTGWIEILLLCLYSAWLTRKIIDPGQAPRFRLFAWKLFAIVFFLQLGLGIAGFDKFLMTGKLHLPVPALIVAGPLYRGGGLFMLILFSATVLLVGPAWCSYLCYVGAFDGMAAAARKKPVVIPKAAGYVRIFSLVVIVVAALALRAFRVGPCTAAWLAGGFGLAGVGVMVALSRRAGVMVHCTSYCPLGLVAVLLAKLNPFRIRIAKSCTQCGACTTSCRYNALRAKDIERRKPALSCTLCGDCINSCRSNSIGYNLFGLSRDTSRKIFLVMVISIHAAFLGLARI